MQVFIPYPTPYDCALSMVNDTRRMNKQIIECQQILKAIDGYTKAWANHPVTLMYREHRDWQEAYKLCFQYFRLSDMKKAKDWSDIAMKTIPLFITQEMCDQHKRRLFTKSPQRYPQFADYGTSNENWYFVDGKILKYVGGKRI